LSAAPVRDHAILIVEDNEDVRELLRVVLEGEGYATQLADDGAVALEVLRTAETLPSLIMLDLRMPNLDGYGFRAQQLADPALADIPVVLCSSEGDLSEHARAIGSVAILRKPFHLPEIVSVVSMHGRRGS
jgi:CheY-like chemotaxis protein